MLWSDTSHSPFHIPCINNYLIMLDSFSKEKRKKELKGKWSLEVDKLLYLSFVELVRGGGQLQITITILLKLGLSILELLVFIGKLFRCAARVLYPPMIIFQWESRRSNVDGSRTSAQSDRSVGIQEISDLCTLNG